jgi:hypothetical protein
LQFAREHHPELAELIGRLRSENRQQYNVAIRELAQARDRLTRLQRQAPKQYDLALAAWKLDSRAHLLAARMTMSKDPGLEAELKRIVRERVDVRLQEQRAEQQRLRERLSKLEASLAAMQSDPEAVAARDLQRIKKTVAQARRPAKAAAKGSATDRKAAAGPVRGKAQPLRQPAVARRPDS